MKDNSKRRKSLDPAKREEQLIAMAVDLAEQQLANGTASSQVISHYLRLGSTKERLEREMLQKKVKLLEAQTKAMESAQISEELYREAIAAMKSYSGKTDDEEDSDEEDV